MISSWLKSIAKHIIKKELRKRTQPVIDRRKQNDKGRRNSNNDTGG